jgi:hypothetical protein
LHLITEPSFERANKECLDLVLSAIPSAIHDVHLLRVTDSPLETEVDPAVLHQYRQVARHQVIPHINTSRNLLAPRLARYGLDTEHLPKSIGGKFGFDRFFQWQELRTRYEWGLPAGVGNKASADMFGFGKEKPLGDLTEEEKHERKRKLNVIHSRRKRERERIEAEVFREQVMEEEEDCKTLRREYERLQGLLNQANSLISSLQ